MVDRTTILGKVAIIDECLRRIDEVRGREGLERRDVEEIVILNLQRAIQAGIDVATHVIATEGLGLPDSLADAFSRLGKAGILNEALADRLKRMVGFRNVVVHAYEAVDPDVVEAIVESRLVDLRDLSREIIERFRLGE